MSHRSRIRLLAYTALLGVVTACESHPPTAPALDAGSAALTVTPAELGGPLPFLTLAQRARFERGRGVFQTAFTAATGLGPLFNNNACSQCHEDPVVGAIGEEVETHQAAFHGGVCDDLSAIGGPVIQDSVTPALHQALQIDKEGLLPEATATAKRTTPSLLGFGLLEAVPDAEIMAFADPNDRNGDGITGRPNRTADGRLGRFGRKAQFATLREFNAGAFLNEMGITSPAEPNEQTIRGKPLPAGVDPTPEPELSQEAVDAANTFVQLLAPPDPLPRTLVAERGRLTFLLIGCASCHVPALVTGPAPVKALSFRIVEAYTDLLLHNMGPDLADICLGRAKPAEFRTEPLMGLRFKTAFLHDGRAASIAKAIHAHGGEASAARNRFVALSPLERGALLQFLRGL
jgi:CxxC motif-containing protein (DUF1111 family)